MHNCIDNPLSEAKRLSSRPVCWKDMQGAEFKLCKNIVSVSLITCLTVVNIFKVGPELLRFRSKIAARLYELS